MSGSWTVRPAAPPDAQAMHAVYHRVRPNWPIALDRFAARIASPKMVGLVAADEEGRIAGYAGANALSHVSAVFTSVYVDPIHQGAGVGSLLWTAIEREASGLGADEVQGYVQDDDQRSIAILRRWGFEVIPPYEGGPSEDTYVPAWALLARCLAPTRRQATNCDPWPSWSHLNPLTCCGRCMPLR